MPAGTTFLEIHEYVGASSDPIVTCDSSARIVMGNPRAADLLGYQIGDLPDMPLRRIFSGFDRLSGEAGPSDASLAEWPPRSAHQLELTAAHRDGTSFPVRASITPVSSAGSVVVVIVLRDLREEKRREQEIAALLASERAARSDLGRANRLKDEFLAVLSHELRTPLNAMLGWTQILQTSNPDEKILERAVDTIERNIRLQARLIEDLLDMSAIASGKFRLEVAMTAVAPIVEGALDIIAPVAVAKGVALEKELDPELDAIEADRARLQQVVWNLLSNAVKFTPEGGKVRIRATQEGAWVQIEVQDTGQGIDPTFLPHLFDRFRQADASLRRGHGGLGLGLSIVKSLVEMHQGSVRAESGGLGHGSTFVVRLPREGPAQGASIGETRSSDPFPALSRPSSPQGIFTPDALRGVRVLVVDDEPDARDFMQRVLEDFGAEVVACASAREALHAITERRPHLIFCDIGMPGEDGYQFIQKVKALGAGEGEIPAVALTAYSRDEDREKSLELGFRMHVSKPAEPMQIVEIVAALAKKA